MPLLLALVALGIVTADALTTEYWLTSVEWALAFAFGYGG
jgi:hypothetical protein